MMNPDATKSTSSDAATPSRNNNTLASQADAGSIHVESQTPQMQNTTHTGEMKGEESTPTTDRSLVVWWEGDNDPENPLNWPSWRKLVNCALISGLTFMTPLASSVFAPGVPELMREFGSDSNTLASLVVSVYILGFAFGPMIIAPLSEIYGRMPVYHVCNVCFIGFVVGCALAPSLDALIVFRFLSGTFGACPVTNGGGSIADLISQERRAGAMSAFAVGPLIGPVIGPVIGGVLTETKGWRWTFWVVAMVNGVLSVVMLFTLKESYAPVILQQKAARLRKETGDGRIRSKLDMGLTTRALFRLSIIRPAKLLIFSPICTIFALFLAIVYGYLYLLFTSISYVFKGAYGFSTTSVGLVYLGLGVGSLVGMAWFGLDSNREVKKNKTDHGHEAAPEVRLKLLPIASALLPAGYFIYGWTTEFQTHWMGPICGLFIIGFGNVICFMSVSMYLVDAYARFAASALASNTIIRSIAGAFLPLCALDMYDKLGLGWGNSLLGFIAVALIPFSFVVIRYGERLRTGYGPKTL